MLGGNCQPCCKETLCDGGVCGKNADAMPETVTVAFGDIPATEPRQLVYGVVSSCGGGGGAVLLIEGTVGNPDDPGFPDDFLGPISGATIINRGGGYATYGRVPPSLTVTGSGAGAEFTVSVVQTVDDCGLPAWKVAAVEASGDLSGYEIGEQLTVTPGEGDLVVTDAAVYYQTGRGTPTVTATASGGTGAAFAVSLARRSPFLPASYRVSSVSVAGGTGYVDGTPITFEAAAGDTVVVEATATLATQVGPPTGKLFAPSPTGFGATFKAPTLTETFSGSRRYRVGSGPYIDEFIDEPGSGYQIGDVVTFSPFSGTIVSEFEGEIDLIGPNGEIEGIAVMYPGEYFVDSGVPVAVTVTGGGNYHRDTGGNLHIENPGLYYHEDEEADHLARPIEIILSQSPPSEGVDAKLQAVVDLDPESETYGGIVGVEVIDGGSGYMAAVLQRGRCTHALANTSVVLQKNGPCEWSWAACSGYSVQFGINSLFYDAVPQYVRLVDSFQMCNGCPQSFQELRYFSPEGIPNCQAFSTKLESVSGATCTVSSGGDPASNPEIAYGCKLSVTASALGQTATLTDGVPGGQGSIGCQSPGGVGTWSVSGTFGSPAGEQVNWFHAFGCPCVHEATVQEQIRLANGPGWATFRELFWFGTLDTQTLGDLVGSGSLDWQLQTAKLYIGVDGPGGSITNINLFPPPQTQADLDKIAYLQEFYPERLPEGFNQFPNGPSASWTFNE